tara:strand:- start:1816 stop:3873 length:2058 start_codon:yes stop_codon:yes gene_type:complete
MKSPKVKGIGEVVTEYGAKVMKIFKKGLLQRSLFDFYGDVKANAIRVKESSSVPQTPVDNDGGVVYVKNSDGKLYYKSNEVSEVELSAHTGLSTEEVQDIAGPLVATGGTKTNIAVTYDDASGNMDFVVASDLNTTGSAATLTTARAINGVDFDGSAPITITAAGSTLSDTVPVSKGGTGATSFADKAVIITQDSGTDTLAAATMSTNGQLLIGGTDGPAVATLTQGSGITITNANGGITLAVDNDIDISGESGTVDNIGNLTGDVTSSNRATTIANDAVTYAKMQNVSATNVVLGRDSAGAGVVEEISAANLRTIINVEDGATTDQTQSDINGLAITTVGTIGTGVWQGTTIKTAYIGDDQITEDKLADTLLAEIDANTAKVTNVSTNLTYTTGSDRITIVSSDGTNVVISEASGSIAGVMTVAHHDKLDGIEDSATADQTKSDIDALGIAATTAVSLTAGDKTIDGSLDIGSNTAGHDFTVYGATTNFSKMRWDASQDHLHFSDQAKIVFGTGGGPGGSDSSIQADGSNLVITNSAGNIQIGDTVEITGDLDVTGNVLPGITYVKILPSDFVPDDVGRPAMIDDTGSDRWLESHGTAKLFAYVDIPVGFKATHVDVYGSATSAVTVYEADVNSKTVTSKGTGNIGTQIDITDVNSDATNYILIELAQASGEEVYGGKLTIAKI